jgi:signal transduction histidine kinase
MLRSGWWTPLRADAALAGGIYAVEMMMMLVGPGEWYSYGGPWLPLTTAITLAPIAIRRRWLWVAAGLTGVLITLGALDQRLWSAQGVTLWVVAYTLAAYETWWRAMLGSAALWLANNLAFLAALNSDALKDSSGKPMISLSAGLLINAVVMVVTFMLGRTIRARRERSQALAERASVAESGRQAHAEQAVAEERRRIARELHDVVAHHVSVIGVMATGARRVLKHDFDAAEQALTTIEQTSRTTLRELRRLLFLLRVESESESQLSPQPGLEGMRSLVEQVREAGLPAVLRVEGEPSPLDPGVALTAYRIVQEALTNALKHAGPATAEVRLTYAAELLSIEVFDTGHGPREGMAPGHGLLGMRERVAVYGGTLRTGPRPGGGFRVYAKIPVECPANVEAANVEAVA